MGTRTIENIEKGKRISELEGILKGILKQDYGASYQVFLSSMRGNKKLYGEHITVYFPHKVNFKIADIVALFEKYYGYIAETKKITTADMSGELLVKQLVLVLKE